VLRSRSILVITGLLFVCSISVGAQQVPRAEWGAPAVTVVRRSGQWIIAGKKNKVRLNESDLALQIEAGTTEWKMAPSSLRDMFVKGRGAEFYLRLADAKKISIVPYDTGFKTGVKISLSNWQHGGASLDLSLFLTVCLEGRDEDLVSMSQRANTRIFCGSWIGPRRWTRVMWITLC